MRPAACRQDSSKEDHSASTGIKANCVTSKSPMSVSFSSGITGSDMKHSVITGSTPPLMPRWAWAARWMRYSFSATHSPLRSLISPAMGMGMDSRTAPSLTRTMPPFCSRSFSTA